MSRWTSDESKEVIKRYRAGNMSRDLKVDAERLFNAALMAAKGKRPLDQLADIFRSCSVAFEIAEYYVDIPKEMYEFFIPFLDSLTEGINETTGLDEAEAAFRERVSSLAVRASPKFDSKNDAHFVRLGTEALLLALSGVACLYRSYRENEGLERLGGVRRLSAVLARLRKKSGGYPSSLAALIMYYEGKLWFSTNAYAKAEECFGVAKTIYMNKVLYSSGPSPEEYDSRMLATRRYALSQIFGLASLYVSLGRLKDARKVCDRSFPYLTNTGEVMRQYSEMILAVARRGLMSDDAIVLRSCRNTFEKAIEVFTSEVPESHYLLRCQLELATVETFEARLTGSDERKRLFDEAIKRIDVVLRSRICREAVRTGKNRRLRAEALALKSFALRNLPHADLKSQRENVDTAISLAKEAAVISEGMSQVQCDCLLALGMAYVKRSTIRRRTGKPDTFRYLDLAGNTFFDVLRLNNDATSRVSAIAWLRLADLELNYKKSAQMAELYFERSRPFVVEHKYVRKFAEKVEKGIAEYKLRYPAFRVDIADSLNFDDWAERLKVFLVDKAVYKIAADIDGALPSKSRKMDIKGAKRTPRRRRDPSNPDDRVDGRLTASGVLRKELEARVGLNRTDLKRFVDSHTDKFMEVCAEIRTKSDLAPVGVTLARGLTEGRSESGGR